MEQIPEKIVSILTRVKIIRIKIIVLFLISKNYIVAGMKYILIYEFACISLLELSASPDLHPN